MGFKNKLTKRQEEIIYNLACEWEYNNYSSLKPFEIDYKFWEDVPVEWLIEDMASKIEKLEREVLFWKGHEEYAIENGYDINIQK